MKTPELKATVSELRQFLTEAAKSKPASLDVVRQQAAKAKFPYPELAAQVYQTLQGKRATLAKGLSTEDISEAFMTLLMDSDALEALGGGKKKNPWLAVREILQKTGLNVGSNLLEVYEVVRKYGLGYVPTILDLSSELGEIISKLGPNAKPPFTELADRLGIPAWKIALAAAWLRRNKKEGVPTDADLEEIFSDAETMKELSEVPGPWEVYSKQAEALTVLRHFAESMVQLGEAVE